MSAKTYERIAAVVPFQDVAFYNYFQRPAENKRSIKVTGKDEEVARNTLLWVLSNLNPKKVIVASQLAGERITPILDQFGIDHVVTDHPTHRFRRDVGSNFAEKTKEFLGL